jgi:hypothetical protein
MRARSALLVPLAWILLAGCQPPAETPPVEAMPAGPVTGTVESADGVPIVYESPDSSASMARILTSIATGGDRLIVFFAF